MESEIKTEIKTEPESSETKRDCSNCQCTTGIDAAIKAESESMDLECLKIEPVENEATFDASAMEAEHFYDDIEIKLESMISIDGPKIPPDSLAGPNSIESTKWEEPLPCDPRMGSDELIGQQKATSLKGVIGECLQSSLDGVVVCPDKSRIDNENSESETIAIPPLESVTENQSETPYNFKHFGEQDTCTFKHDGHIHGQTQNLRTDANNHGETETGASKNTSCGTTNHLHSVEKPSPPNLKSDEIVRRSATSAEVGDYGHVEALMEPDECNSNCLASPGEGRHVGRVARQPASEPSSEGCIPVGIDIDCVSSVAAKLADNLGARRTLFAENFEGVGRDNSPSTQPAGELKSESCVQEGNALEIGEVIPVTEKPAEDSSIGNSLTDESIYGGEKASTIAKLLNKQNFINVELPDSSNSTVAKLKTADDAKNTVLPDESNSWKAEIKSEYESIPNQMTVRSIKQEIVDDATPEKTTDEPTNTEKKAKFQSVVDQTIADSIKQEVVDGSTPEKTSDKATNSLLPDKSNFMNVEMNSESQFVVDQTVADSTKKELVSVTAPDKITDEVTTESTEISKLSLNQLKKYYKWCNLGLNSSEAISKAKEPGLVPQTEDPHPDCNLPFDELKQISLLIPAKHPRNKFVVETVFGGKNPEEQLKLAFSLSALERHPDCKQTWDDLKKMSAEVPKESKKMEFMVETYYQGKDPVGILKSLLPSKPSTSHKTTKDADNQRNVSSSHEEVLDKSIPEFEISKLSLNERKKYYKWRILGLRHSEAAAKARESGLIPQCEGPHPDCMFTWEEINEISSLVPGKHPRAVFQVEVFFGGKDPGEQLKLALKKSDVKPHADCKHTWEDLEEMSKQLPKEPMRWKFVVDSYRWGKSPSELLKSVLSNATVPGILAARGSHCADSTIKKSFTFADGTKDGPSTSSEVSDIEDSQISKLPNGKLKIFYLWRNSGLNYEEAFLKACKSQTFPGSSKAQAHPKCTLSMVELKKMADALTSETIPRDRFIIHTYFGGKDPERTSKYIISKLQKPAENIMANEPENSSDNIISIEELKLANGSLRYYFLWRNRGLTHEKALSNVQQRIKLPGTHEPHPNCQFSEDQLRHISRALKANKIVWDRYFVYTYFGGKDPELTLKYLTSSYQIKADDLAGGPVDEGISRINAFEKLHLPNEDLKKFFFWLNRGVPRETALLYVQRCFQFFGKPNPHSECMHSKAELRRISRGLSANQYAWDRYLLYTYYGGMDPEVTLRYFLSVSEKACQPEASVSSSGEIVGRLDAAVDSLDENLGQPEKAAGFYSENSCRSVGAGCSSTIVPSSTKEKFSLVDDGTIDNRQLTCYYLWRNQGLSHEMALSKIHTVTKRTKTNILGHDRPHPNCKLTEAELRQMSRVLKSRPLDWNRFVIHTFHGGMDPEATLKHFMLTGNYKQRSVESSKKPKKKAFVQFEPVAKRTRSVPDSGIIPLDSPNHPSKELSDSEIKNYYLWINQGFSREEAMTKAKTPGLIPVRQRSRCLVPLEDLKRMSMKLPAGTLRETFIIETYYAGNDPEYLMEYMLSKSSSEIKQPTNPQPQGPAQKPTTGEPKPSVHEDLTVQYLHTRVEAKCAKYGLAYDGNSTVIEEGPVSHLSCGKLKYYYLWRNKGLDQQEAMRNVKKKKKIPGFHAPHPSYKHWEKQAKLMMETLPFDKRERFIIHVLYGGKDPECVMKHFNDHSRLEQASNPNAIHELTHDIAGNFVHNNPCTHQGLPTPAQQPPLGHPPSDMYNAQLAYGPSAVGMPQTVMPYQYEVAGPSHVAYLPPPVASPVQPYGQIVTGPLTIAYTANQHALPVGYQPPPTPVIYPEPQNQAVIPSGYITVQPFPVGQPLQQTPPLSESESNKSATAQFQSTKAAEPLVGVHDPKLSSLKRKATDELPIKINLKSTSNEPKPPKQSCREEIPLELDSSAPMFIVPTGHPEESLSESQMDALESSLLEAILEMDDDGTKPSFKDTNRSSGRYGITCIDQFSVSWLHKFLNTYQPCPDATLKLISNKIRANAILPPCKGDNDEKILRYIERQNKGLNVALWTVVQRWDNGDFNTCMDLGIDEESAKILEKSSKISFKLSSAEIITSRKGTTPTSGLKDNSTHKNVPDSLAKPSCCRSHPQKSAPPTSKYMRTEEGYPNLYQIDRSSPLGDRERTRRVHDGSPRRNSACRSPSQDRFGHPISPTLAPVGDSNNDDEQSYLDWFYAKEGTSARRSSSRSRSPETYSESLRSMRVRRLSNSRSPSPEYSREGLRASYRYREESPLKKRRRAASPSPSSSSDEYGYSRDRSRDSRHKPSRYSC